MNCQNFKCTQQIEYNSIISGTQVTCDNCSNAFYCSTKCRDFDWKGCHQSVCSGLFEKVPKLTVSQLDDQIKQIGQGSFGIVYLKQLNGYNFAIKKINKNLAYRELKIHKQLKHKHIIQLLQFIEKDDYIYLILEYAKNGHIRTNMQIDPKKIIYQLCQAIQYLHNKGIIHRDIKPKNVLLSDNNNVKLCDFGLATYKDVISNFSGTYEFMAPEILRNYPQSFSVDIWSLGCLLYWMLEKKSIVQGNEAEMIEQIINFTEPKFTITDIYAKDLIMKMLNPEPENRITLNEIMKHPYFHIDFQNNQKIEEISNSCSDETSISYHPQQICPKIQNDDRNLFQRLTSLFSCMARDK